MTRLEIRTSARLQKLGKTINTPKTDWLDIFPAVIGKEDGTVNTGVAGEIYVRNVLNGQTLTVHNTVAPAIATLQVEVGRRADQPGLWQVKGVREAFHNPAGSGLVPYHASQHAISGADPAWVDRKQVLALSVLVKDAANFIVQVYGTTARTATGIVEIEHQEVDLSAEVPATGALYVNIESDNDGVLTLNAGTNFTAPELATAADIPVPAVGQYRIATVLLYEGMTALADEQIRVPMPLEMDYAGLDVGYQIHAASASAVTDSDEFGFWEDVSGLLKKITWANIKATLKTYFDTLYAAVGSGGAWGGITGTLSAQTDLQAALDAKAPSYTLNLVGSAGAWATATAYAVGDNKFWISNTVTYYLVCKTAHTSGALITDDWEKWEVVATQTQEVSNTAYDATGWNAVTSIAPSKDAVRDKIVSMDSDIAGKVAGNTAITGATKTKITYDSKGLVTAGADATTADIADSTNKRYVTDAQLTVIGNTSGTNSGNETTTTIGALIGAAGDATPNDTDFVATSLTAGGILKKITWTNVKAFLKTYWDTLYAPISKGVTNGDSHDHVGGDGAVLSFNLPFATYIDLNPMTASGKFPYAGTVEASMSFVSFAIGAFATGGSNHSSSNYYSIALKLRQSVPGSDVTIATVDTQTLVNNTAKVISTTTFSPTSLTGTGYFYIEVTKTGTPTNTYLTCPAFRVKLT